MPGFFFPDKVSNFRSRILTNQKGELVVSNCQWNCIYEIQSNNLNLNYPNLLIYQIDFCFSKLYFSSLIQTKIECINKQLLFDVDWPNKAIWMEVIVK